MPCIFAKYSDIFGKPKTGFHSFRIYDIAINDVIGTILLSGLISYIFDFNFLIVLVVFFILGIIMHRLFCVNTTINKLIFKEIK